MKIKWQKFITREGVDLPTITGTDATFFELIEKFTKSKKELFFTYFYNKSFSHFWGINPYSLGEHLYQQNFNTKEKLKNYYRRGLYLWNKAENIALGWSKKLKNNHNKELFVKALRDFKRSYKVISDIFSVTPFLPIEAWQSNFQERLRKKIKRNKLQGKEDKIWFSAFKPWKKTSILEAEVKIKKGVSINKIIKDYQFLRSWAVVWYRPIDSAWVKNVKMAQKEKRQRTFSNKKLSTILKLNNKEKRLLEVAPYLVYIKDWRDDIRRKHAYYWSFLFDIIAEKYKINRKDLGYFSLDEIEEGLIKGFFDKAVIKSRKHKPVVISKDFRKNKIKIIEGRAVGRYKKIVEKLEKTGKEKVMRGIVAQTGFARSIVKILKTYHDIKRVKEGDIIVAITTHPNYLPAMKKASAFVTDEGGIASHAAIVAREFKKPCIVGTKVATKILKDGDLVEVDANRGAVEIIKKQ